MHLYVTASRDTTSFIPIYFHNDSFLCKTKKCNSHHKKYKLNEFRDWWLLWCLFRLLLFLKRWQKTNKKNIFVEKITDTFENLCCNIRNVKSDYLKYIASQCLSPPCVLLFLLNFDGRRARVFSSILSHNVLLPSNVASSESSGPPFSFARLRAKRRNLRLFQLQLKKWTPKYLQHTRYFNMKCYQSPYPSERKRFLFATWRQTHWMHSEIVSIEVLNIPPASMNYFPKLTVGCESWNTK